MFHPRNYLIKLHVPLFPSPIETGLIIKISSRFDELLFCSKPSWAFLKSLD